MMGLRREHIVQFFQKDWIHRGKKKCCKKQDKKLLLWEWIFLLLLEEDKPWNFGIHWIIIIVVYFLFREKIIINFSRKNSHCWRKWCSSSSIFKSSLLFLFVF